MDEIMSTEETIDLKKQELLVILRQIREECRLLITRTYDFEEDVLKVKTEEEAEEFDQTHDLEEGLVYIHLYD